MRGASEMAPASIGTTIKNPLRKIMKVRTLWWLILSGVGYNFATYAVTASMVPLLQRYFEFPCRKLSSLQLPST